MTLPLEQSFEMQNENPKSGKLTIILLAIFVVTIIINELLLSLQGAETLTLEVFLIALIAGPIFGVIGIAFSIGIQYFLVRIVIKISRNNEIERGVFSGVILKNIYGLIFSVLVVFIHFFVYRNFDLPLLNVDSLGVFYPSSAILNALNLTTLFSTYLLFILLRGTAKLTSKKALIWSIIYFVITVVLETFSYGLIDTPLGF